MYLLHLELDGRLDFIDFPNHGFLMGQKTREFTGFVETRSKESRNLLDERFAGQEGVVFLGCAKKNIR